MFIATPMPKFTPAVGVAPATTTMSLNTRQGPTPGQYQVPYGTMEDLRSSNGLGVINETDAWLTGRPYGLPGTATIKLTPRAPYGAKMVGGGFGDVDLQLQQLTQVQVQQEAALKRIAFWQMIAGSVTIAALATGVVLAVMNRGDAYARRHA